LKNYKVDIVIPIYNNADLVKNCVDSVLSTTDDNVRIILVDDCSPGNEIPNLFDNYKKNPRIYLHRSMLNQGFIGTTRIGARIGNSSYILFLNSDIIATEKNWVDKLIPKEKNTAIVGAKLLFPKTHPKLLADKVQHAGVAVTNNGKDSNGTERYGIFHIFSGYENDFSEVNRNKKVNTVTGACFLVRRDVWNRLGGWDLSFGKGVYEDVDFCWRTSERGYNIEYNPSTFLYHYESTGMIDKTQHPLQKYGGQNFQTLLNRWSGRIPLNGDSFYGKGTIERWKEYSNTIINATIYLNGKDYKNAEKCAIKCIDLAPELPGGHYVKAVTLFENNEHLSSIGYILSALKTNPIFWIARFKLIEEFIKTDQVRNAVNQIELVKEVFPNHSEIKRLENMLGIV